MATTILATHFELDQGLNIDSRANHPAEAETKGNQKVSWSAVCTQNTTSLSSNRMRERQKPFKSETQALLQVWAVTTTYKKHYETKNTVREEKTHRSH